MVTRILCLLGMLLVLCVGLAHAQGTQQDGAGPAPRPLEGMAVAWQPGKFEIRLTKRSYSFQPSFTAEERATAHNNIDILLQLFGRRIEADMVTALNNIGLPVRQAEEARWRLMLRPSEAVFAVTDRLNPHGQLTIQASLYDAVQAKVIWTDTQNFWGVTSTQEGEATVLEFADKLVGVMRRYLP